MERYRNVPPRVLLPTELMALVFSRKLLKPLDGTAIKASLDSALNKAATALPPEGMNYVQQMQKSFAVGLGPHKTYRQHQQAIDQLTRAIAQSHTVQMRYYSASQDMTNRREADPYRLWYTDGSLYLIAHCHRHREVRMFAVDRIRSLTITNQPCQLPLGFDFDAYVQDAFVVMRGKQITVELLFDRPTAAWVKDRQWHQSQQCTVHKDGQLSMPLQVADMHELGEWILHFGRGVRIIDPPSLRDTVLSTVTGNLSESAVSRNSCYSSRMQLRSVEKLNAAQLAELDTCYRTTQSIRGVRRQQHERRREHRFGPMMPFREKDPIEPSLLGDDPFVEQRIYNSRSGELQPTRQWNFHPFSFSRRSSRSTLVWLSPSPLRRRSSARRRCGSTLVNAICGDRCSQKSPARCR